MFYRALYLAMLLFLPACKKDQHDYTLPVIATLPDFSLRDHENNHFSPHALRGKVWTANFFFTHCQTVCPLLMQDMAKFQAHTADLKENLQLVSISVDPQSDTPQQLKKYSEEKNLSLENWTLLTGENETIRRIAVSSFKQAIGERTVLSEETKAYDILHGTHVILVDRRSRIRGFYSSDKTGFERLRRDVRHLINED